MIYKIFALTIFVIASLSFIAWLTGVDYLTYIINPNAVIKPITALCFGMTAVSLYSMLTNKFHLKKINTFITTLMSCWILLVMFLLLFIATLGSQFELMSILYSGVNYIQPEYSPSQYLPSVITITLFVSISLSGFVYLFNTKKASLRMRIISNVLISISVICLISIIFDIPNIYDAFNYVSTGISFPSSICFILTGIVLRKISKLIKYKNG